MKDKAMIGFVGTGVMGQSVAGHLLSAGHQLCIFNRTKEKARALLERGGQWKSSPGEVASSSEIIITMVGFPKDVEAIYFEKGGILDRAKAGSLLIDMTTSSPKLARRIYEASKKKGIAALDAPVSGGDIGAREARLSIMVGGDVEAFERARPIFEIVGKNIILQGESGAGAHTKMCNQIAIASGMMAICEAMAYAERSGLNPQRVLKSIQNGAAASWSLSNLAPRLLEGDFEPGFFVKHFLKDMKIAIDEAEEMGLMLPGLKLAKQLYDRLEKAGGENDGTQALFKLYQDSKK